MLELQDICKHFGTHEAVRDLSLNVREGEFVGLIGPNGAGKTTTLRIAVGHLQPTSGVARVDGEDVMAHPLQAREKIGYVPEMPGLYEYLTGAEYVDFVGGLRNLPQNERQAQVLNLLEMLDLGEERDRLIRTYSQGMRRKVALAGALIGNPKVLILDEAMNGLDPTTHHRLTRYLTGLLEQGCAILLSSHVLAVLEKICTRIVVMKQGTLVASLDAAALARVRQQEGGLEQYFVHLMSGSDESSSGPSPTAEGGKVS